MQQAKTVAAPTKAIDPCADLKKQANWVMDGVLESLDNRFGNDYAKYEEYLRNLELQITVMLKRNSQISEKKRQLLYVFQKRIDKKIAEVSKKNNTGFSIGDFFW